MSPTFGVASVTPLAIARSLCRGVTLALLVLFPGFGSGVGGGPIEFASAVFVKLLPGPVDADGASTVATMSRVTVWLSIMSPIVHTPVPISYVPMDGVGVPTI